MGSGTNGQLTFIDLISILSFVIGIENLDYNISQEDFQNATAKLDATVNEKMSSVLNEIHAHLEQQDDKIDRILEVLTNDSRRNL